MNFHPGRPKIPLDPFGRLMNTHTVDGRNQANQLIWVEHPIFHRISYVTGGDRRISDPSKVSLHGW